MKKALLGFSIFLIMGCVSAPRVQLIPEAVLSAPDLNEGTTQKTTLHWWLSLQDEMLDELIEFGLEGSPTPQVALARFEQAQIGFEVIKANRWPSLLGLGSRDVRNISGTSSDTRSDLGVLGFSWDAGLWGKRRLEIENARQFKKQRWYEYQSVQLALSASIAETYFQIIEQQMQLALLNSQLEVSRDLERLIEARFSRGQSPVSDLYQQRESTQSLKQLKIDRETNIEVLEKSLDVLVGEVPDSNARVKTKSMPSKLKVIDARQQREQTKYRPDIRAGYARLQQVASVAGIRFAERLPSLQVTANLTSVSERGATSEWVSRGLDLAIPIYAGGRLRDLEHESLQALEEERQSYLALWLAVLEEVDGLNYQYRQQKAVITSLEKRRGYASQALNAARNRYVLGDQNYLEVLVALKELQNADRFLISEQLLLVILWVRTAEATGQPICQNLECLES